MESIWREADVLWQKVDDVFKQADKVFAEAARMDTPKAEINQHRIRFNTTTWRDRRRTAWIFFKLAVKMLVRGKAELKFRTPSKHANN
jgi:hypothetical protein